jgi:hypothetical protein
MFALPTARTFDAARTAYERTAKARGFHVYDVRRAFSFVTKAGTWQLGGRDTPAIANVTASGWVNICDDCTHK